MDTYKQAAVILLHDQETDSLLLTRRTSNLRTNPGEFCFPGGGKDDSDPDLWSTALRELHEELGINAARVSLLKELSPEHTLTGKIIFPWLASIAGIEPYIMNENEVSGVITLPMEDVIIPENYKDLSIECYGKNIVSCQYTASSQFVYGATARIMKQLCYL